MVACKILLICLAVVAMNARSSKSQYIKELKDCACFPRDKGRVRISNLADKYGKHERTVVYIFKHPDTRKVTVYVPSEEKQIKFPDLTVNNLESYSDYTYENLHRIIYNHDILKMDPIHTHVIDYQIPDVHRHHKIINHIHPHVINIKPDIKPNKKGRKPVSPDLIDIDVDLQVDEPKNIDRNMVLPQLQKHEPVINVIEPVNIVPGPKKHVHITNDHTHHKHLNQVDVPDDIHIEVDQNNPEVDVINGQETKIPTNINIKQITDEVNQNLSPIVVTKPRKSVTIIDNVMQETDINSVKRIEEMLNLNNNNVMPSSVSLKQVNNPVFHRWLIEEISNVGAATYDTMEIHRIKIRLLLVLEQSGLRFSENGDLIDMNGHVIKISNLKLRRVMISDPVVYKKLGGKCVPRGIPYLEAVFVNLVYPPTVLGVIPLRMTSLPRCNKGKCRKCAARKINNIAMGTRYPYNPKLNLTPIHSAPMGLISRMGSEKKNEDVLPTRGQNEVNKNDYVISSSNGHTGENENKNVIVSSNGHTRVNKNKNVISSSNGHTGVNEDKKVILSSNDLTRVNENKNVILSSNPQTRVNENKNVILSTRVHTGVDNHENILPPTLRRTEAEKYEAILATRVHTGVNRNNLLSPSPVHLGVDKNEDVLATRVRTGIHDGHDRQDDVITIHNHDNDDELGIRIIGGRPATSSGTPVSSRGRSKIIEVSSSAY